MLIIDGTWLARKSYHASPNLTFEGSPIGAMHTYIASLIKLLRDWEPDYCSACFDLPGVLDRSLYYPEYKANRPKPNQDYIVQVPIIKEITKLFGVSYYEMPGHEADDLIATLVSMARGLDGDNETIIHSVDRDMWQLVSPDVWILSQNGEVDEEVVKEKTMVRPDQIIELKALIGDASDEIPRFFGEVTAGRLLCQYGTVDGIYEHLDELSEKNRNKLLDNKEQIYLNRNLVTLVHTLKVPFPDRFVMTAYIEDAVLEFLDRYGFNTLEDRFKKWRGMN